MAKKMKKGQGIKMAESIMVLFIFMILLGFGLGFYMKYQKGSVQATRSEKTVKEAVEIAQIFSTLPEVACSFENVKKENCIDILKLERAEDIIKGHQSFYFPYFKYSEIIVYEIYPEKKKWVLYNNSLERTTKLSTPIPIALYDGKKKANHYGYMEVNYYQTKNSFLSG